ncbi:MAG TPA: hypothetical protein VL443_24275 [Cyclobacteriaceae bacterium]|nr:hypothetical protein [Cyclobacteriaceae bacterium]
MITLRPEQRATVDKSLVILKRYNLLYLAAQVRTGKTFMSLTIAKEIGWRRVCFITKKMAISSIKEDYQKFGHLFDYINITNFEQAEKLHPEYDGYIVDESVSISAFPKPGVYCKALKKVIQKKPVILMCGTPCPESYSQIFHQFWISYFSPFSPYANFYRWADDYVIKKIVYRNGFPITEYKNAKQKEIMEVVNHYMVTLSQEEAGFVSHVEEEVVWVDIDKRVYQLMDVLKKDKVYKMKNGNHIVCDTPVKMQSVFHQLSSGTVITEEDKRELIDESKAWFIKSKFAGQKIAIYYQFVSEGDLLRKVFPLNTNVPEVFNEHENITFICQLSSGRMGVNLSTADALVLYNIAFSAITYWQVRARMQSHSRTKASKLFWIFSKNGIEKYIHAAVTKKKDYTLNIFKKDFGIK